MARKILTAVRLEKGKRDKFKHYAIGSALVSSAAASVYIRSWREEHLNDLPLASQSGVFYVGTSNNSGDQKLEQRPSRGVSSLSPSSSGSKLIKRDLHVLALTVARAGLMGTSVPNAKSVKVGYC